MTYDYLLKQLLEAGELMRNNQKCYFNQRDPASKKAMLPAVRKSEDDFDKACRTIRLLLPKPQSSDGQTERQQP